MTDFLTALIRREQGFTTAEAVVPRLPLSFEAARLEQFGETAAPEADGYAPARRQAEPPLSVMGRESAPRRERLGMTSLEEADMGAAPLPAAREQTSEREARAHAEAPQVTAKVSGQPDPLLAPSEPPRIARAETPVSPRPTVTPVRAPAEPRVTLVEQFGGLRIDVPTGEAPRVRETPVIDAVLPRPRSEPVPLVRSQAPPAPVIQVTIGRVEVRAVPAVSLPPAPPAIVNTASKPRTLDEYLEERNARRGR